MNLSQKTPAETFYTGQFYDLRILCGRLTDTPPASPAGSDAVFVHLFVVLFYLPRPETEAHNQIADSIACP